LNLKGCGAGVSVEMLEIGERMVEVTTSQYFQGIARRGGSKLV